MVDRDLSPQDFEVVSFLVAGLSYGRVEQIQNSLAKLFEVLFLATQKRPQKIHKNGAGLCQFLKQANDDSFLNLREFLFAEKWKHRLNTAEDIVQLFMKLSELYKKHHSLCAVFQLAWHENPRIQIEQFCDMISPVASHSTRLDAGERWRGTGLGWFAASPKRGGTSKRLIMWLRWMIRKDNVDLGYWSNLKAGLASAKLPRPETSRLFIPVDTHLFQWARREKITTQKTPNWKTVERMTAALKKIAPHDPARYDFALCQEGIRAKRKGA